MEALARIPRNAALERRKRALAIIQAVSERHPVSAAPRQAAVSTDFLDSALPHGGLARGAIHEWIGVDEPEPASSDGPGAARQPRAQRPVGRSAHRSYGWSPPLTLLVQIARQSLTGLDHSAAHVIWVGQSIWPYAPNLAHHPQQSRGRSLLAASLFVQTETARERVWAADLALRSRCAASVVVDGSGFDLSATRRLQLAAEAGGALCLLARPPWEQHVLSAANTRWAVRCCPSFTMTRRWTVELLRCKGVQPTSQAARLWTLERHHATRHVAVVPDVLSRPRQAEAQQAPARRTG